MSSLLKLLLLSSCAVLVACGSEETIPPTTEQAATEVVSTVAESFASENPELGYRQVNSLNPQIP